MGNFIVSCCVTPNYMIALLDWASEMDWAETELTFYLISLEQECKYDKYGDRLHEHGSHTTANVF